MHAFTFPKSVFPHWRKRDVKKEPSKVARGLKSRWWERCTSSSRKKATAEAGEGGDGGGGGRVE